MKIGRYTFWKRTNARRMLLVVVTTLAMPWQVYIKKLHQLDVHGNKNKTMYASVGNVRLYHSLYACSFAPIHISKCLFTVANEYTPSRGLFLDIFYCERADDSKAYLKVHLNIITFFSWMQHSSERGQWMKIRVSADDEFKIVYKKATRWVRVCSLLRNF